MVNGIGNQVSFRAVTSADLNQRLNLAQVSPALTATESDASAQLYSKENDEAEQNNHTALKTVGTIAVLAGIGYLAKTGRLGETAQKYYNRASEFVTPKLSAAWEATKSAYTSVKDKVANLFGKKAETIKPETTSAEELERAAEALKAAAQAA